MNMLSDPKAHILTIPELEKQLIIAFDHSGHRTAALALVFRSTHAENVVAGWWTDLATGTRLTTRNFGELSALIWSEIAEAILAFGPDDKLPTHDGQMVEIVDALVRLSDLIGSGQLGDVVETAGLVSQFLEARGPAGQQVGSPTCLELWADFFETGRRGKPDVNMKAARLFAYLVRAGQVRYFSLADRYMPSMLNKPVGVIYATKVAYNRQRADHKIENRLLDGGKKL